MNHLDGLVPEPLRPRSRKILIEDLVLSLDIGFHEAEIGHPQRVFVTLEIWVDETMFPETDDPAAIWDHDEIKSAVTRVATERRYQVQESLARAIYDLLAAHRGVLRLRVTTRKPDIYPDCAAAGVQLASF